MGHICLETFAMIRRLAAVCPAALLLLAACAPEPPAGIDAPLSAAGSADRAGATAVAIPTLTALEFPELAGFAQAADPALAVDPASGELLVAFLAEARVEADADAGGWNLWFSRVTADRRAGPLVRVNDQAGEPVPHAEGSPRLVAFPGGAALLWNNSIKQEGRRFNASDLRFARSTDDGLRWSAAISLQDPVTPEAMPRRANTFHGAAWDGKQGLVVAWLDGRERDARRLARGVASGLPENEAARTPERFSDDEDPHDGDATIFAAVSADLGASWGERNLRLEGRVCPCCRITLLPAADGTIHGAWREHFPGSQRDPVYRPLLRAGEPLAAAPLRIHEDAWEFPGCPHSGPGLALDAQGTVHSAWYTGAPGRIGVWYARKRADQAEFEAPLPVITGPLVGIAHPAIVVREDGSVVIAQNVSADGRRAIVLTALDASGRQLWQVEAPDSEGSTHPQLALPGDGRVVVAWTQSRDGVESVRIAQLREDGA